VTTVVFLHQIINCLSCQFFVGLLFIAPNCSLVDQKQDAQDNQQKFVPNQQTQNSNGERTEWML
jgi:hypothetical protein